MSDEHLNQPGGERESGANQTTANQATAAHSVQVHGDRVLLGDWSGDLMELIGKSQEVRELMRDGRRGDATRDYLGGWCHGRLRRALSLWRRAVDCKVAC